MNRENAEKIDRFILKQLRKELEENHKKCLVLTEKMSMVEAKMLGLTLTEQGGVCKDR